MAMAHYSRVSLTGIALVLALYATVSGAQSESLRSQHKQIAAHSTTVQPASVISSPAAPDSASSTLTRSAQVSHWQVALFVIEGWLGWGVILYLVFHRRDAAHSMTWKIRRYLIVIPFLFCLGVAFWPITLIYFYGRCWNCHKWGHHARYCPEHLRCWSCGELGHKARFCPKGPTANQQWTFIRTKGLGRAHRGRASCLRQARDPALERAGE